MKITGESKMDPGLEAPSLSLTKAESVLYAFATLIVTLIFIQQTGHVWEDYLITFRHSRNLVDGNGLVYNAGARVHGFTSPLGTLLPSACYLATGCQSHLSALWAYRAICIAAYAASLLLLLSLFRKVGLHRAGAILFAIIYLADAKSISFTVNGMESALMQFFVALSLYAIYSGPALRWHMLGVGWGGIMWTRPDGFLYIAALALSCLLFQVGGRRTQLTGMLKAGILCACLYLPWFAGAWTYYGSPIPQTVQAKFAMSRSMKTGESQSAWAFFLSWLDITSYAYLPIYFPTCREGWPGYFKPILHVYGAFASFYWLLPLNDRVGRAASFCFAFLCAYLAYGGVVAPWYLPPIASLGIIAIVRGSLFLAASSEFASKLLKPAFMAMLAFFAVQQVATLTLTMRQVKIQQSEIEDGIRTEIGLWLKDHVKRGDRVYLEPLGYIGYFCDAYMVDFPGLASPQVSELCKRQNCTMAQAAMILQPEWLVLRPLEQYFFDRDREFAKRYKKVKSFDATARLAKYDHIPGRSYLEGDAKFSVFRRVDVVDVMEVDDSQQDKR